MGIESYSMTASSNGSVYFEENMSPADVNNDARSIMADIRTWYENPEFRDLGHTPTFASTTTFTISGDVTASYVANQRIECYGTIMGALYGFIASSSYSAPNTTITVTLDAGSLTSNLSRVSVRVNPTNKPIKSSGVDGLGALALLSAVGTSQIDSNSVTEVEIQISNNASIVGRNNADDGDVSLIKVNASDDVEFPNGFVVAASQTIDAGSNKITNVTDPTSAQDVATKAYVDREQLFHLQDQKSGGTDGGGFSNGAWRTRTLNAEPTNNITGASRSGNQAVLPAGTYYFEGSAPAYKVGVHVTRLYDTTNTTVLGGIGTSEYASSGGNVQNRSFASGTFTLSGTANIELQHRCEDTVSGDGFGRSDSDLGVDSVFADLKIWKTA